MRQTHSAHAPAVHSRHPGLAFHHVGIQTNDLENSVAWYEAFLGCQRAWSLDRFSELTLSRLPGIRALTELVVGGLRLHLFERPGALPDPAVSAVQFQHLCLHVDTAAQLPLLRQRWLELFESGRYSYARDDPPTEVVTDSDGVQSFYAYDVNGLELELTYLPPGTS
jgi:catechol 2,3-dioxygenase-like lactoylglutathione lyase family enzyme